MGLGIVLFTFKQLPCFVPGGGTQAEHSLNLASQHLRNTRVSLQREKSGSSGISFVFLSGALAGLMFAAMPFAPCDALTRMPDDELRAWAKRHSEHALITPEEVQWVQENNLFNMDYKLYGNGPTTNRPEPEWDKLSHAEFLKAERVRRQRALEEAIPVEDGWMMKIQGPARLPFGRAEEFFWSCEASAAAAATV